jgi:hypothetical protein
MPPAGSRPPGRPLRWDRLARDRAVHDDRRLVAGHPSDPEAFAADRGGRIWRTEIAHPPWPLQTAEATIDAGGLAAANGLTLPAVDPIVRFAACLDVHGWPPSSTTSRSADGLSRSEGGTASGG